MQNYHTTSIPVLGIDPKELKGRNWTDTCTLMFTAVLFTIVKRWEQPKYPTDGRINKMSSIRRLGEILAIKMNEISHLYEVPRAGKFIETVELRI